ncbi:hypothetical protein TcWFU_006242 [Taenia crassiceps]|uniref:Uncharacterized protein n=1 Tax=Taenia crassiceps TaxID=6207 RepID=A0ABR4Q242_9CEST
MNITMKCLKTSATGIVSDVMHIKTEQTEPSPFICARSKSLMANLDRLDDDGTFGGAADTLSAMARVNPTPTVGETAHTDLSQAAGKTNSTDEQREASAPAIPCPNKGV